MSDLPPLPPATPQHHGAPGLPAGPELAQAIMDLLPTQRRTAAVAAAASGGEVELRQATPEPSARAPAPPPRSMAERLYQLLRRLLLVAPAAAGASSASAADLAAAGSGALAASGRPGRLQAFSSAGGRAGGLLAALLLPLHAPAAVGSDAQLPCTCPLLSAESLEQFGSARSSASDLLECGGSSHGARLFVDALSAAAADEEEEGA